MSLCELCNEREAIKNSHIIPKFTSKWLARTSLSGRIRYTEKPNVPLEDTRKTSLLCKGCEAVFSSYEGYFAEKVFRPYVESLENRNSRFEFDYDGRLEKFAVSMAWRIAQTSDKKLSPTSQVLLENYKKKCREFLLDKKNDSPNANYLYFFSPYFSSFNLPLEQEFSLNRSLMIDLKETDDNQLYIVTKLSSIFIYSVLSPFELSGWQSCRISKNGNVIAPQLLTDNYDILFSTFRTLATGNRDMDLISDKQRNKILGRVLLRK